MSMGKKFHNCEHNLCDLLLLSFKAVSLVARFVIPIFINSKTSVIEFTEYMLASGTANPFGWEAFQIPIVGKSREILFFLQQENEPTTDHVMPKFYDIVKQDSQ